MAIILPCYNNFQATPLAISDALQGLLSRIKWNKPPKGFEKFFKDKPAAPPKQEPAPTPKSAPKEARPKSSSEPPPKSAPSKGVNRIKPKCSLLLRHRDRTHDT